MVWIFIFSKPQGLCNGYVSQFEPLIWSVKVLHNDSCSFSIFSSSCLYLHNNCLFLLSESLTLFHVSSVMNWNIFYVHIYVTFTQENNLPNKISFRWCQWRRMPTSSYILFSLPIILSVSNMIHIQTNELTLD